MHTKDELLKIKWESAIRLDNVSHKLKKMKARYFKICLIDLPRLPKDHPETIKVVEELNIIYKEISSTEEEFDEIAKNVEKLHKLIHVYKNKIPD